MIKYNITKIVLPTLLAAMSTTVEAIEQQQSEANVASSEVISQTITRLDVQIDQKDGDLLLNITGNPGFNYRIYYSLTDDKGSYRSLQGGSGVVGENGTVTHTIDPKTIDGKERAFLKVFSSDASDFSGEVWTIASPIELRRKESEMTLRGTVVNWVKVKRAGSTRTPVGGGAVRGHLPEEVEVNTDDWKAR